MHIANNNSRYVLCVSARRKQNRYLHSGRRLRIFSWFLWRLARSPDPHTASICRYPTRTHDVHPTSIPYAWQQQGTRGEKKISRLVSLRIPLTRICAILETTKASRGQCRLSSLMDRGEVNYWNWDLPLHNYGLGLGHVPWAKHVLQPILRCGLQNLQRLVRQTKFGKFKDDNPRLCQRVLHELCCFEAHHRSIMSAP